VSAELAARITAARAALGDYGRAAEDADVGERAMWGAVLADMLASLLDALGEPDPGDAGKLAAIRDVLAHFDWSHHDRQLALEEIDRIARAAP
jgi:hypothetical protein